MFFFKSRKRLPKRRIILPLLFIALIAFVIARVNQATNDVNETFESHPHTRLHQDDQEYTVVKKIVFICGEEITEMGKFKGSDIYAMLIEEPHLELEWSEEGAAILLDYIEDFLPNCKDNAYFSVDGDGNLSLFEGPPEQKKVLRTFFQIDIQHLKSSLPKEAVEQLYSGIKVIDFSAYNSVLSTFADFAVNRYTE